MKEETIIRLTKELEHTKELFFVSKSEDGFRCINSDMSNLDEWIDNVDWFLNDLKRLRREQKGDYNALKDIISNKDITEN